MNKAVVWVVVAALIVCAWFQVITRRPDDHAAALASLRTQIDDALALNLPKRTIPLYLQAISYAPRDLQWRTGLADAYQALGDTMAYRDVLVQANADFPEDVPTGVRLLKYWVDGGQCQNAVHGYEGFAPNVQADAQAKALFWQCAWKYVSYSDGRYTWIGSLSGGHFPMKLGSMYGYLGSKGGMVIPALYQAVRPYIDGWAAVQSENNWFYLDEDGDRILAFPGESPTDAYSFSEGYAPILLDGSWRYIDKNSREYGADLALQDARPFANKVAPVKRDGKWGLIDQEFAFVVNPVYDDIACAESGVCTASGRLVAQTGGAWRVYDLEGKQIGQDAYDAASSFQEGVSAVKKGAEWSSIDASGAVLATYTCDEARPLYQGVWPVRVGTEWKYVTTEGEDAGEGRWTDAANVSRGGTAVVSAPAEDDQSYRVIQFYRFMK